MTDVNHQDRAHSEIGASSASRWLGCPGSVNLSRDVPEEESSPFAADGTSSHELSEACFETGRHAACFVGQEFNGIVVDEEKADHVQYYLDKMKKYTEDDSYDVKIEERFEMPKIHKDMFGSNDFCAMSPGHLVIVDFKYGKGVNVFAKDNIQMIIYALGAYYKYNDAYEFEDITLAIVQPRIEGGEYDEWNISIKELLKYEKKLKAGVKAVYSKKPKLASGDHCKWCKAKAKCPLLKAEVEELVNNKFDAIPIDGTPTLPSADGMSLEELSKVLTHKAMITEWLSSVSAHANHLMHNGDKIPGFKVVAKKSNRKIANMGEFKLNFESDFDIYAPPAAPKLLTLGKLEKLLGKKEIAPFLFKPDAGTTIAPNADKRAEVVLESSEDQFNEAPISESNDYSVMEF